MRITISLCLVTLITITGCNGSGPVGQTPKIIGSGVIKEEKREVPAFTGVEVLASLEAVVTIGDKPSVTLQMDDNLLSHVKTEVKDGRLMLDYTRGGLVVAKQPPKVIIVVPSVDSFVTRGASKLTATLSDSKSLRVEVGGASSVKLSGLSTESLELKADGASQITLIGKAKKATIFLTGASTLIGGEATIESAGLTLDGSTNAEIFVTSSVEGYLGGASSLKVKGEPYVRNVRKTGVAKISY